MATGTNGQRHYLAIHGELVMKKTIRCLSENMPRKIAEYGQKGYRVRRIDKEKVGYQEYAIVQMFKED